MTSDIFRYEFDPQVNSDEIEASMLLALVGTEALHGETETQLNVSHFFDCDQRVAVISADHQVGHDFNTLFAGYLRREFGPGSFRVRRIAASDVAPVETAA